MSIANYFDNGHNGNGTANGKKNIFNLVPAQDELTFTILETRRNVLAQAGLSRSAKAFFAYILDLSLNREVNERPGVVTISEARLAKIFAVSVRSIFSWKRELVRAGWIWMSKNYVPNMWPQDVYHVASIDPPKHLEAKPTHDGMWGTGKTRSAPQNPGMGARTPGQTSFHLPGSKQRPTSPESEDAKKPIIAGAGRESLRVPAEENCGPQPKKSSGGTRRKLRVAPEENCGREPKKSSGESRRKLRATAEVNSRHKEDSGKRLEAVQRGEGEPAPVKTAERNTGAGASPENGIESALAAWSQSLDSRFPSKLEKLRDRLIEQRKGLKSTNQRDFILRKIAILNEVLDGPMPAEERVATTATSGEPQQRPPTLSELVEGAQYLISIGKESWLTKEQKEALSKYPELTEKFRKEAKA